MRYKATFQANDAKIREVLFGTNVFRVPRFQRPYAWCEDHVSEFWNDLMGYKEPFYLGSFIFNHEHLETSGYIDVIDGQQRLLTITMFIAVLRDLAQPLDEKTADLYQRQDIAMEDRSGKETFRIIPGDSTKKFYSEFIQKKNSNILDSETKTKEERQMKDNYLFFRTKVMRELDTFDQKSKKIKLLNELRQKVADLTIVKIDIQAEEAAYEIFESTNARGVDLSVADLLKNLIFKNLPPKEDRDFAKEEWQDVTSNIEATNTEMKKFIRYDWISRHAFVTERRLFRSIKREITDWAKFLDEMWTSSDLYNKLYEGQEADFSFMPSSAKMYKSIFAIRLMNVSQCYVLLLALMRNAKKLHTDPRRVFELIEKFTFQYSVVNKLPGNKVERMYSRFANEIEHAVSETPPKKISGAIQRILAKLTKELRDEIPSYQVFKENFMEIEYKNSEKSRQIIKYILSEINGHHQATKEQKIDFSNVNIEHLLPQKPNKKWKLKKEDIKGYVSKLGNLTLVSKKINSVVQNDIIPKKIRELEKSMLPITKTLVIKLKADGFKWGEEQILARQEQLADLAYHKIWNLE